MGDKSFINRLLFFIKRFAGTNIIWFIFNLPIIVLGFMITITEGLSDINIYLISMIILAPFVLFPATAAMFGVIRKFVMDEDILIIPGFFQYYRENYLKSVVGGIFFTLIWVLLGYIYLLLSHIYLFVIVCGIIAIVLFMFTLNYISMIVHMEVAFTRAIKNALLFTISGNVLTIGIGLLSMGIVYVNFKIAPVLIPFFSGSIIAYIAFWTYYRLVIGIQVLQDKQAREAKEVLEVDDIEEETEKTLVIDEVIESEDDLNIKIEEVTEDNEIK